MTEAGSPRIRYPQIARHPAAEMPGIRCHGAIRRQYRVDRLAQRSRINEPGARLVRVREMMVVAGANAPAHRVAASTSLDARHAAPVEFGQQRLRRRPRVAVHGMLDRHLVAELRRLDVDLRDYGAGGDQLALLGGPLCETHAETENEIAVRDQLIG